MVQDPTQEDDAPGLRRLLDEMHGSDSSLFTEEDSEAESAQVETQDSDVDSAFSVPAGATPSHSEPQGYSAEPLHFEPPQEARPDLEQIPVTLDFSLRTMNKTLGEVSQIQEGEIITLGCGPEGPVELKANGRTFAKGRLVMVEEQLAVEIIEKLQ
ncbi:MAG TPA: hypothetical protein DHW71_09290 [Gammaproteobacteria bacterium]|nr:hypothetical protein [Gammaproteobacteria bacterium]HBF06765.1 hypothetical protein [Gammaproteobacteria bacterium]HCK93169.1 hypothetical protein [Gammaproteobacteria bacterium]|tara:strand:- start:3 stop:470 length:468 start_codon:yes stop_codon:yes gene_type:complete